LPKRLARSLLDYKGRTQVPLVARKIFELQKNSQLDWWIVDDTLVVAKPGTGTPNPFPVRGNSPSAP
jgi:hypothetical protein